MTDLFTKGKLTQAVMVNLNRLWVLLCGADGLLGFFHDDPHPNPSPPVGGYGQRTGRLLRPPP